MIKQMAYLTKITVVVCKLYYRMSTQYGARGFALKF